MTGVQTCALPISSLSDHVQPGHAFSARKREEGRFEVREELTAASANAAPASHCKSKTSGADSRVREGEVSGEYEGSRLGAMDDYPRNINELETRFSTEEACRVYLFRLRWPEGFRCPRCGVARRGRFGRCVWNAAIADIKPR